MPRMSKTAPAKTNAALRRREVAELRARKLTFEEIAEHMGISQTRARQLWTEWDAQFKVENTALAETVRDDQLNEIRLLKNVWFPVVISANATARHVDSYIKLLAHEAAISGAKAPVEVKNTLQGPNGGPVQTIGATADLSNMSTEQLAKLQAVLREIGLGGTQP